MAAEVQGRAWETGDMTGLAICTTPPDGTLVLRQHLSGTLAGSKRQLGWACCCQSPPTWGLW